MNAVQDGQQDHKGERVFVLRIAGEVCIKSRHTRRRFQKRLRRNIRQALDSAGIEYELVDNWFRLDVRTQDPRAGVICSRIFGLRSVRPATCHPYETIDDIVRLGVALRSKDVEGGIRFAVRAKRVGPRDKIPFTSLDLAKELGAGLYAAGGKVDLTTPEVTVGVEIREGEVFFFDEDIEGPGGLPLGTEGRALLLISGGFDSAVAGWLLMRRGIELDFLFFNLGGPAHEAGAQAITRRLVADWSAGYDPVFHSVDFRPVVADMKEKVRGTWWQLLLKRLMMRTASELCSGHHYPVMITGESAGQVSSQTLHNLASITAPIEVPILRPLVGFNKEEITQRARHIGTYDLSAGNPEFCALDGGRPVTKSRPRELSRQEMRTDAALLQIMLGRRSSTKVSALEDNLEVIEAEIDSVPEGAVVIDVRNDADRAGWAWPESIHMPFERAIDSAPLLPVGPTYVFYCEVGLKSAFLAEGLRSGGHEAFGFRGGTHGLKRYQKRLDHESDATQ